MDFFRKTAFNHILNLSYLTLHLSWCVGNLCFSQYTPPTVIARELLERNDIMWLYNYRIYNGQITQYNYTFYTFISPGL